MGFKRIYLDLIGKSFFIDESTLIAGEQSGCTSTAFMFKTSLLTLEDARNNNKISDFFYNEIIGSATAEDIENIRYLTWKSCSYFLEGICKCYPDLAPSCVNTYDASNPNANNARASLFPLGQVSMTAVTDTVIISVHLANVDGAYCNFIEEVTGPLTAEALTTADHFYFVYKSGESDSERYSAYGAADLVTPVTVSATKIILCQMVNATV